MTVCEEVTVRSFGDASADPIIRGKQHRGGIVHYGETTLYTEDEQVSPSSQPDSLT